MNPIEVAGIVVIILEAAALTFLIWAWFRDKKVAEKEKGDLDESAVYDGCNN